MRSVYYHRRSSFLMFFGFSLISYLWKMYESWNHCIPWFWTQRAVSTLSLQVWYLRWWRTVLSETLQWMLAVNTLGSFSNAINVDIVVSGSSFWIRERLQESFLLFEAVKQWFSQCSPSRAGSPVASVSLAPDFKYQYWLIAWYQFSLRWCGFSFLSYCSIGSGWL